MTRDSSAPAVSLAAAGRRYGSFEALRDVTLDLPQGQIWGLLGHNGAGKTTMMKLLLGLLKPTSGTVTVLGASPAGPDSRALRRRVGYLPEAVVFYDELTGREALRYFARLKNASPRQADHLLERVDLAAAADRRVKTYSKGMRQRLGLAQALLGEPRLLLLDEPTVGLDPTATMRFYHLLGELRDKGVTILLSSHVLPGIERHVDRVAILGRGGLLASGTMDELRARSRLPVVIRVSGSWAADQWDDLAADPALMVVRRNGHELEVSAPASDKLDVVRRLVGAGGVEDLAVTPPTLDSLYAHFSRQNAGQGDRS